MLGLLKLQLDIAKRDVAGAEETLLGRLAIPLTAVEERALIENGYRDLAAELSRRGLSIRDAERLLEDYMKMYSIRLYRDGTCYYTSADSPWSITLCKRVSEIAEREGAPVYAAACRISDCVYIYYDREFASFYIRKTGDKTVEIWAEPGIAFLEEALKGLLKPYIREVKEEPEGLKMVLVGDIEEIVSKLVEAIALVDKLCWRTPPEVRERKIAEFMQPRILEEVRRVRLKP